MESSNGDLHPNSNKESSEHSALDQSCWPTAFERFWNAWLIPEFSSILRIRYTSQKPRCLQESSRYHRTPSELRYVCPECVCMRTTGSWSLIWLKESLWIILAIWYDTRPAQTRTKGQASYLLVGICHGLPNSVRIGTTLSNEPRRSPNWWYPDRYNVWTKDKHPLLSHCQWHLQIALSWLPGDLLSWGLHGYHRKHIQQAMNTTYIRNDWQGMDSSS